MTSAKQEADRILVNFLRNTITDIQTSRGGAQWIYPDFPRVQSIGDNQFPRIGITLIDESSQSMGIFDDTQFETITFQIDIVTKKGIKYAVTTTDEAMGTITSSVNSNRLTYEYIPNTVTNIKHAGSAFGTVTVQDTDSDFTAPGSLAAGTVEWSYSTGNLNFSAADVTSYDTQAVTSTSILQLEGKKACQYLAREVVKAIRGSWRTDETLNGLFYPLKVSNVPIPFDEDLGIFRQTLEYQFRAFNAGEGL
jgi:hypothetical protein